MVFQPADELHGALGEWLDGLFDDVCAWVVLFEFGGRAGVAGFRPALVFGFVDHAAALADFLFHEGH